MIYHFAQFASGCIAVGNLRARRSKRVSAALITRGEFFLLNLDKPDGQASQYRHAKDIRLLPHINAGPCLRPKKCGRPKLIRNGRPDSQPGRSQATRAFVRQKQIHATSYPDDMVPIRPDVQSVPKLKDLSEERREEIGIKGAMRIPISPAQGITQ